VMFAFGFLRLFFNQRRRSQVLPSLHLLVRKNRRTSDFDTSILRYGSRYGIY